MNPSGFDAMILIGEAGYLTPNLSSVAPNAPQNGVHYFRSDRSKSAIGSEVSQKVPAGTDHIIAPGFNPGKKCSII